MPHPLLTEVTEFLSSRRGHYLSFMKRIRQICDELKQELGPAVVRDVYGRAAKQPGGDLKAPEKIARALLVLRRATPGVNISPAAARDILGLTVVVHYPDEVVRVAELLRNRVPQVEVVDDKRMKQNGYYAHHLVFKAQEVPTIGLHCEVQIKTMLHDACGAKTHDLNYKPQGRMDDRLSQLMQVFGDALESIELQSTLLRDLIKERWHVDQPQRKAVRTTLFSTVPKWRRERKKFSTAGETIGGDLEAHANQLENGTIDPAWVGRVVRSIDDHASASIREAAWLAIQLAMSSPDPRFANFAWLKVKDLLPQAPMLVRDGGADAEEIATLPLSIDALGLRDDAIEASYELLTHSSVLGPTNEQVLQFNLANFLVEQALAREPRNLGELAELKPEVHALLGKCRALRQKDASVFDDLDALLTVAASDDGQEIRRAIDQFRHARDNALEPDKAYANATYELNVRLGWRRLLELESRQALRPA